MKKNEMQEEAPVKLSDLTISFTALAILMALEDGKFYYVPDIVKRFALLTDGKMEVTKGAVYLWCQGGNGAVERQRIANPGKGNPRYIYQITEGGIHFLKKTRYDLSRTLLLIPFLIE